MNTMLQSTAERPRRTFWSIQYLRGLAALAVVVFHASTGPLLPPGAHGFTLGLHGVDVFFVISGFIMFTAARQETLLRFAIVRIIRIYPLYWLALATLIAIDHYTTDWGLSGREVLSSALLWPRYSLGHPDKIWPILVPGWTLTYELLFYAIFAVGIATRRVVTTPVAILTLLIVAGLLFHPHAAPLVVATSPQLAEFVIGLTIGVLAHRGTLKAPLVFVVWAVAATTFWLASFDRALIMANAGGIVAAGLLAEPLIVRHESRALRMLGDASYAIYLVHTLILWLPEHLFGQQLAEQGAAMRWAVIVLMVLLGILLGIGVHFVIERPLLKQLRRLTNTVVASRPRPPRAVLLEAHEPS